VTFNDSFSGLVTPRILLYVEEVFALQFGFLWSIYSGEHMDEGRKRVIGIMAAGEPAHANSRRSLRNPQGSPRTDKLIAASIQWAVQIMKKIDAVCGRAE
jgi:hypothetical protein